MNKSRKTPNIDELNNLEDALIETTLNTTSEELRAELVDAGQDPDALITIAQAKLTQAIDDCGRQRFEAAKAAAIAFRKTESQTMPHEAMARSTAVPSMPTTLAARKGKTLSAQDEKAVLEALADLERLEAEDK